MLVTFKNEFSADVTLFGKVALNMLEMMGLGSRVPSALYAKDVAAALNLLKNAIKEQASLPSVVNEDWDEERDGPEVSMEHRAQPLIQLLTKAMTTKSRVRWG